jgi:hypothetical protein
MYELKHHFLHNCEDIDFLLETNKLSVFINRLIKQASKQDPDCYDPLDYLGDGWEFFAEFFFKFHNGDHTFTYLWDYEPNLGTGTLGPDRGIDGFGKSTLDGSLATVQCKFSADPNRYLTNEYNVTTHTSDSLNKGLVYNGKNLICFTSAAGIHHNNPYADQALCLNRKLISRRVNGNVAFWTIFRNTVKENLNDHN